MNTSFNPGVLDESLRMENNITKTASFAGTPLDLNPGFKPGGVGMPINAVTDVGALVLGGSAGASTWTGQLTESDDSLIGDFTPCGPPVTIAGPGVMCIPGIVSKEFLALKLTLSGATGTGTLSLSAWASPLGFAATR